jgi:hypothetical protein
MTKLIHFRRLRLVVAGFVFLLIFRIANARATENEQIQWQEIHQLCGRVTSVVSIKKVILRPNGKKETLLYSNPMKGTTLILYRAEGQGAVCCSVAAKMAETVTDSHGGFRFTDYDGGYYWLVVQFKNGEAKVPIKVDNYEKRACEAPNVQRIIFPDASPKPRVEVRII